jgi:hypothetical protein
MQAVEGRSSPRTRVPLPILDADGRPVVVSRIDRRAGCGDGRPVGFHVYTGRLEGGVRGPQRDFAGREGRAPSRGE